MKQLALSVTVQTLSALGLVLAFGCGAPHWHQASESKAVKEGWDPRNDPTVFGVRSVRFDQVPDRGGLPTNNGLLWAGYYWPTQRGGVSYRWQTTRGGSTYKDYVYKPLDKNELLSLSNEQLSQLSPAEKMDIFMGRLDFPFVKNEQQTTAASVKGSDVPTWYGICHGWAAAATREKGPVGVVTVDFGEGRKMSMNYADIEAFMAYGYADSDTYDYNFLGSRCDAKDVRRGPDGRILDPECRDINPATLHLVAAEYIAKRKQSFVINTSMNEEVWNYPVAGYAFAYGNLRPLDNRDPNLRYRAPGTKSLIDVNMRIAYANGASPSIEAPMGSRSTVDYSYTLELDANNYIIGGEWLSRRHPDFIWEAAGRPIRTTDGFVDMGVVDQLVEASRAGGGVISRPGVLEGRAGTPATPGGTTTPGGSGTVERPTERPPVPPVANAGTPAHLDRNAVALTTLGMLVDNGRRDVVLAQGLVRAPGVAAVRLIVNKGNGAWEERVRQPARAGAAFQMTTNLAGTPFREAAVEGLDAYGRVVWREARPLPR